MQIPCNSVLARFGPPCGIDRFKQLWAIIEDSLGEKNLPPDLPPDDQLIAVGMTKCDHERDENPESR